MQLLMRNPIFNSKISNSSVQGPKLRKNYLRKFMFQFIFFWGGEFRVVSYLMSPPYLASRRRVMSKKWTEGGEIVIPPAVHHRAREKKTLTDWAV